MYFIQRKDSAHLETVDEFTTRREAIKMCQEYNMSDPFAQHYVSTRACKAWGTK